MEGGFQLTAGGRHPGRAWDTVRVTGRAGGQTPKSHHDMQKHHEGEGGQRGPCDWEAEGHAR